MAEAPVGWIKEVMGFRRFSFRGLEKVQAEWDLVCLALVGAGERWKNGDFNDFAPVSDGQRWWAMIQVVLQVSHHLRWNSRPSERGPGLARRLHVSISGSLRRRPLRTPGTPGRGRSRGSARRARQPPYSGRLTIPLPRSPPATATAAWSRIPCTDTRRSSVEVCEVEPTLDNELRYSWPARSST